MLCSVAVCDGSVRALERTIGPSSNPPEWTLHFSVAQRLHHDQHGIARRWGRAFRLSATFRTTTYQRWRMTALREVFVCADEPHPRLQHHKLTRVVRGDAWRSLDRNGLLLMSFLMDEHMAHAGTANGKLKAPYRQLEVFGLSKRLIGATILDAERKGLIDCHRGGQRVATTYTLTWLSDYAGNMPSNRWRQFRNPELAALPMPKNQKSAPTGEGSPAPTQEGRWHKSAPIQEGRSAKTAQKSAPTGEGASKNILTKGGDTYSEGRERSRRRRAAGTVNGHAADPDRVVVPAGADISSGKPVTIERL